MRPVRAPISYRGCEACLITHWSCRWVSVFCVVAITFAASVLNAQSSQPVSVTAVWKGEPLNEVLIALKRDHGLQFSYLESAVADVVINCQFTRADWAEVAECLFTRHGLEAKLLEDGFVTLRPGGIRDWNICLQTESKNGTPLPFVSVGHPGRGISLSTDDEGKLATTIRVRSTDTLTLHYLGYGTLKVAPALVSDGADCEVIQLPPSTIELAAVTVTEYLTEGISATADGKRVILAPNELSPLPGFADQEITRSLTMLPGLVSIGESAGDLSIRGGTPDQNLVLWDNIPVYSSGHYLGMVANFSPELVDEVDVWRGQAEAEYGGHVSGVIRMTTDREVTDKISIGGGLSLLQANADVRLPLAKNKSDVHLSFKGSLPAQTGWPAYDSYRAQALQGYRVGDALADENPTTTATESFSFREWNGRWQFNPAPRHRITVSGFLQDDGLNYDLDVRGLSQVNTDALETNNKGASLHYVYDGGIKRRSELWVTRTNFSNLGENEYVTRLVDNYIRRESGIRESSAKWLHTEHFSQHGQLQGGVQAQRFDHNFSLRSDNRLTGRSRDVSVRDGRATVVAPFTTYKWSPAGPFRAQFGLRLPWYGPTGSMYFEPRINAHSRLDERWLLKAGYGINHQFALQILNLNQTNVSRSAAIWTLADGLNFPVQTSQEVSVGISGQPRSWLFDLEVYQKQVTDLTATTLSLNVNGFALGDSRSKGLDLLVRKRWGNWRSWLVYSLSETEWRFPEVTEGFFPADLDRRHRLRFVQSWKHAGWTASMGWEVQSGAPFSPVTVAATTTDAGQLRPTLLRPQLNTTRLSVYHRADLSVSYDWAIKGERPWSGGVTLSLLNIYGRENLLERNFTLGRNDDVPIGQGRFFAQEVDRFGLGFTPNLSVWVGWGSRSKKL